MELLSYLRSRWRVFATLAVLGVVAIAVLGVRSDDGMFSAEARVLMRPPADQLSGYSSDLDRYVTTETALIRTPRYLEAEVGDTGVSPRALRQSLTIEHDAGTEVVGFRVRNVDPDTAVELANAAATGYLTVDANTNRQATRQQVRTISRQIDNTTAVLESANAEIERQTNAFIADNPDRGVPSPGSVAPEAFSTVQVKTARITSLQTQLADAEREGERSATRSELLEAASSATAPSGWPLSTYLAALAGLILLLLALGGAGLAATSRLLSPTRWREATSGTSMRRAVVANRMVSARGKEQASTLARSLMRSGPDTSAPTAVLLPEQGDKASPRSRKLAAALASHGVAVETMDSPALGNGSPVLVVVDLRRATVDDAARLTYLPEATQARIVPVLLR